MERKERNLYLPGRFTKLQIVKTNPKRPENSAGLAIHIGFEGGIGEFEGISPSIVWQFAGSEGKKNEKGNITLTWSTKSGFWFRDVLGIFEMLRKLQQLRNAISIVKKDNSKLDQVNEKIKNEISFSNPGVGKYVFFGLSTYNGKIYVNITFSHKDSEVASNKSVKVNLSEDEFINIYNALEQFVNNYFVIASNVWQKLYFIKQEQSEWKKKTESVGNEKYKKNTKKQEQNIDSEEDLDVEIEDIDNDDISLDISEEDLI